MKSGHVFSREIFPVREWTIPIADQQLKCYWSIRSTKPLEHFYSDLRHYILIVALNGDVFVDGKEVSEGGCLFLQPEKESTVHLMTCSRGVEFLRLEVPDIPAFRSDFHANWQLTALSPTAYFHIARHLIYSAQNRQMDLNAQADSIFLVQNCLNPSPAGNPYNIHFSEVFRLTECLQKLQFTAKAKFTVAQMASLSNLKTYRLQLICQVLFGQTAHQVLRFLKMHTALKVIANQTQTLAAIGKDLEYSSDENFITAFRVYYGITPHAFRKMFSTFPYIPSGKL
ncbi:helix-turn-helix transcriptional regulator [Flavihumibacter solisilvae]|uniref:HTH araC/xylS-type domain-containing protein n=1 Tax=Flavihumibacter solisilvae TaxID=1349421 RepID=A0A0C1LDM0_9BACT|nr:AraC family transcriptional regulator [Flavihumibacter solisilvae]KIC93548.1 hypothetical protein OI18_17560 [Flavihumibacter solisilvae]